MKRAITTITIFLLCFCFLLPFAYAEDGGRLNVKDYGAIGDGNSDDRAAIQQAIDEAAAKGGGEIYFPEGRYRVEEILILKSNISLILDERAVIVNGINQGGHPSIIFMTGPFTEDGQQVQWERTSNISISGGTIDMNGELNEAGNGCKNLPNIGSSGALALGYCDNVKISDVKFLNSYKGHVIQICACDGVIIDNCEFVGQAIPNTLTDSQIINLESIQIEPSTVKGFPYATNATGEASQNITISNCYFGASDVCGEPITAVGTHNQVYECEKCNHINVVDNEFDNMAYAGVRFCGYEYVTIKGNSFIKRTPTQSTNYRANGCFLINAYCYNNTTQTLDLNKHITIDNNTFSIEDAKTRAIRVAKDKETYLGDVLDVTITNNSIINNSADTEDVGIQALRISGDLIITGNTINGGYRGIELQYCKGNITVNSNDINNLTYQFVRVLACGTHQKINLFTHGCGTLEVETNVDRYTFTAVPNSGHSFKAYYGENALTTLITKNNTLTYIINKTTNVSRHASFE